MKKIKENFWVIMAASMMSIGVLCLLLRVMGRTLEHTDMLLVSLLYLLLTILFVLVSKRDKILISESERLEQNS